MPKLDAFEIEYCNKYVHEELEEGILYISKEFNVIAHLCPCGCGNKSWIRINHVDGWKFRDENGYVTLSPSLLHKFPCKSHYFIKNNSIQWCKG